MKSTRLGITLTLGLLGIALALLWLLSNQPALAQPMEWTVCTEGPPSCDYAIIQDAVDAAGEGDLIKVAAGTYTDICNRPAPPEYPYPPTGGLNQVVYINKNVTIRGGYTAPGFTDPPDPGANPTTLDAQGQGRVVAFAGAVSPTIEGLCITGGNSASLGGGHSWDAGGGIYAITATPVIRNNQVFENTATVGGGLYLYESDARLSGNLITSNTSSSGGGLYLYLSAAQVDGNTITANTVEGSGGGVMGNQGNATLSGNTVFSNTAWSGGGMALVGGADFVVNSNVIISNTVEREGGGLYVDDSNAIFSNNTVSGNTAQEYGGGFHLQQSLAVLNWNTISDNSALYGGGLSFNSQSDATLNGNAIAGNTADQSGGGLRLDGSSPTLTGNVIRDNTADTGGGLWAANYCEPVLINNLVADNQARNLGSGIYISGADPSLVHTTIARNTGGDGSGIHVTGYSGNPSEVYMSNTIVASHTVGIYNNGVHLEDKITLVATLWGTATWANDADWAGAGTILTGTINIWDDPAFVAPDVGDYHIGPGSAALDVGVDAGVRTDIDAQPRPYLTPDLGADEYWPPGVLKHVYLPLVTRHTP